MLVPVPVVCAAGEPTLGSPQKPLEDAHGVLLEPPGVPVPLGTPLLLAAAEQGQPHSGARQRAFPVAPPMGETAVVAAGKEERGPSSRATEQGGEGPVDWETTGKKVILAHGCLCFPEVFFLKSGISIEYCHWLFYNYQGGPTALSSNPLTR